MINPPLNRPLKMALVGGAGPAFIGPVHRAAAERDHRAQLVAGALSSDPERGRQAARAAGISPDRAYGSYRELIEAEVQRPRDERLDFVTIATPNDTHFEIARAALEAGFDVMCEKPLTPDVGQAEQLQQLVQQAGAAFAVAHNYSGYPLVRQIREMVLGDELGEVQAVRVNYIQGGLRRMQAGRAPERGAWKMDPYRMGPSGTLADIGTHAYHLLRYTTGLEPLQVSCHPATFVPVRPLEDYAHVVLRCSNGALALLTVSQATHGRLNDLTVEIDGSTGSLLWRHEDPQHLVLRRHGQPIQIYESGRRGEYLSEAARGQCRLPSGHPEGFVDAFANLYAAFFDDVVRRAGGQPLPSQPVGYPGVEDGLDTVRFVQACIASGRTDGWWQPF